MNNCILGIDLGTSSVKAVARYADGNIKKSSVRYKTTDQSGVGIIDSWLNALTTAVQQLNCTDVLAIGLSSQVGTYIINETDVIGWQDSAGADELKLLKTRYSQEDFISHISMPHPDIISYPLPRLMYIKKHYSPLISVCQPKDLVIRSLTGKLLTDQYSWRGLADPMNCTYSRFFLDELGVPETVLPPLQSPESLAGCLTPEASALTGIPEGTPIYTGMNDFFASLVGMGITDSSCLFDITGTSEHVGVITKFPAADTKLVCGPYLRDFVHYGVTASSGHSLRFALDELPAINSPLTEILRRNPPIFAPYLLGERAPIFDPDASGLFFGINGNCRGEDLAYAVLEGVVLSLYHIYEHLNAAESDRIIVSGGAAKNEILNQLKAELFCKEVITLKENDTSALGAVMCAAVGAGLFADYESAAKTCCLQDRHFLPDGFLRDELIRRYHIYRQLYPALRDLMKKKKER